MTNHLNTVTLKYHLTVLRYVFPSFCPKLKGLPWWSSQPRSLAESTTWTSQGATCKQCVPPVAAGTIESHGRECGGDRSGLAMMLIAWGSTYLDISWLQVCIIKLYIQCAQKIKASRRGGVSSWFVCWLFMFTFWTAMAFHKIWLIWTDVYRETH